MDEEYFDNEEYQDKEIDDCDYCIISGLPRAICDCDECNED